MANGVGDDAPIEAGESGVAELCAVVAAAKQPVLRQDLRLDDNSRIVVIGSEGITDPSIYAQIVAEEI